MTIKRHLSLRYEIDNPGKKSMPRNKLIADIFHKMGQVEKIGSGINRMKAALSEAGLGEPRFEFGSFFSIIFDRLPQDSPHDTPHVLNMLEACRKPRSREEIPQIPGQADREHLRKNYVRPALEKGWLAMTVPEKPKSKRQMYVTTEVGKDFLEKHKQGGRTAKENNRKGAGI